MFTEMDESRMSAMNLDLDEIEQLLVGQAVTVENVECLRNAVT